MNKNFKKFDKPRVGVKVHTGQDKISAIKVLLNKGVVAGMAITGVAFLGLIALCGVQDYQYGKQLKTKAKNG